jgi:protein-S-isoprenylcysteine O-methyltransferase Ste14
MFEHWGEFYLLVGSAAAVLIGLIFVVVTLMQDRPRSSVLAGSKLYMGPIVLDVSFVLVLSAAALAPGITPRAMALVTAVVAAWGLVRGVISIVGIRRLGDEVHWSDVWFYGVVPSLLFLGLGAVAWGFWSGQGWAVDGVAALSTALLLAAIRNEWDLVTWLAPRADTPEPNLVGKKEE